MAAPSQTAGTELAGLPLRTARRLGAPWTVMLALSALACGPSRPPIPDAATLAPSGSSCPPGSTLTYESFGRAFFDEYCQTCHASTVRGSARQGAPRTHAYDDRAMIHAARHEIELRSAAGPDAINADMPRTYPVPTLREREQLGEWLACGAP